MFRTTPRILLVANADSPLLVDRVRMSLSGHEDVAWYSESNVRPVADCRIYHYKKSTYLGPLNKLLSTVYFHYVYWRERPDILHIHWALFFPLLLRKRWKNLIVSVMGSDVNLPGRWGSRRIFSRVSFNKAVIITSKSASMDSAILKLGHYENKIRRFTWGVTEEFFQAKFKKPDVRAKFDIPDNALVVFSPRAMQPLYRTADIVEAFVSFATENQDAYLIMAGMNPDESVAAEIDAVLANSAVSSRVIRFARLEQAQMIDCYAAADIVISYAKHDGMPQSLYEAMAVGCFPVFTDLPCYHEILQHDENALLCDSSDPSTLLKMLTDYQRHYRGGSAASVIDSNRAIIKRLAAKSSEQKRLAALYKGLFEKTGVSSGMPD